MCEGKASIQGDSTRTREENQGLMRPMEQEYIYYINSFVYVYVMLGGEE